MGNLYEAKFGMISFSFSVQGKSWVTYIDTLILIICGGIPWQPYYQVWNIWVFSPLVPSKRKKNILPSLFVFQFFNDKIHDNVKKNWKVNTHPSKKCTNWAKLIHFSLVLRDWEEKQIFRTSESLGSEDNKTSSNSLNILYDWLFPIYDSTCHYWRNC